jgi:hypothetical protein
VRKTLFTHQAPYFAEVVGVVGSPAVSYAQLTLDGRILSKDEYERAVDGMSRVPCDKKCLLALEDVCRCRCAGLNHGKWVKSADHDASLDIFVSESGPVMSREIAKGKLELLWLARKEVVAMYGSLLGGLRG